VTKNYNIIKITYFKLFILIKIYGEEESCRALYAPRPFYPDILWMGERTDITQRKREVDNKLCENIGIFIKNYKSTIPGSNKVVYGPFEQESEEKKIKILIFQYEKSYFYFKKLLVNFLITLLQKKNLLFCYTFIYLERSVLMSRFQN